MSTPGFWVCSNCKRISAAGIKTCRKCKTPKPIHGFIEPEGKPRATPIDTLEKQGKVVRSNHLKNENNRKVNRLTEPEAGKFFVSTFKQRGE